MLKRKSEENTTNEVSTSKRLALDSEAVEQQDIEEDKRMMSPALPEDVSPQTNPSQEPTAVETTPEETVSPETSQDPQDSSIEHAIGPEITGHISPEDSAAHHPIHQNEDPTYVHFRMLCSINEAATTVGKGGETINHIKELSNARINVSENLKGVPERVISVRGPAEYVAKAFGLIVRILMGEPLDVPSSLESHQYNLRLLFPHTVMGYIIGKRGSRFREIEESSAAALKANDQILPGSTDRVLNVTGVADAIHIATYYVAQTVIDHKAKISKAVYYNPANFAQPSIPVSAQNRRFDGPGYGAQYNAMLGIPFQPQPPTGEINREEVVSPPAYYFPSYPPQQRYDPAEIASNTTPGTISTGPDGKLNQELFVPQRHIGLVIGRGGKNLKDIRDHTRCYVKINDEVPGATDRKLTLIGDMYGIQNAVLMINNRIENEKLRKQRQEQA